MTPILLQNPNPPKSGACDIFNGKLYTTLQCYTTSVTLAGYPNPLKNRVFWPVFDPKKTGKFLDIVDQKQVKNDSKMAQKTGFLGVWAQILGHLSQF